MIVGRIQLQETVKQLLQIISGVNLFLQDHLQHGLAEIEVRVVGVFLHRHALAADSPESLDSLQAFDVRVSVVGGESGGGVVPGAGGRGVVVAAGVFCAVPPWPGMEEGGQFQHSAAAAAAAEVDAHRVEVDVLFLGVGHCGIRGEWSFL